MKFMVIFVSFIFLGLVYMVTEKVYLPGRPFFI